MGTGFNTQAGNGEYRLQFETDNREYYMLMQSTARRCVDGAHMTNVDLIRSMTDEELAELLNQWGTSTRAWQKDKGETMYWLQQPSEAEE